VSLLKRFYKNNKPLFLLESIEGGERWARYSFLGISARTHIKVFKKHVEISSNSDIQKIMHNNNPLRILKELTSQYIPATMEELPRFWCGMTGYISYEMVSFFENVPVTLPEDKAYAHFIIPDEIIIFDNIKHTMTCIALAFTDNRARISDVYENTRRKLESIVQKAVRVNPESDIFSSDIPISASKISLTPEMQLETFKKRVEQIKQYIIDGDIIQAVLSQKFTCENSVDPVRLYRAQRYINPSPYMFFMHFADITIAGSSPETMVRLENQTATLRPIAGTRKRGKTQKEDRELTNELLNDEKERAEHLMLVDLGRNDLGRIAKTGTVQVTDLMSVEKYSHVMHMVSNITCDVKKNIDAWDIIKATFPAGTLSGAPKIRAMEIISELEDSSRGIYGGGAGYISFSGNMDLAIIIRTAVIENGRLTVQAGAGIVYDSDPQSEYQECINKARSVETAFKLAMS